MHSLRAWVLRRPTNLESVVRPSDLVASSVKQVLSSKWRHIGRDVLILVQSLRTEAKALGLDH